MENMWKTFVENFVEMLKTRASKIDYGGLWDFGWCVVCSPIVNPITLSNFNSIKITQKSREFILTIIKGLPKYYFHF